METSTTGWKPTIIIPYGKNLFPIWAMCQLIDFPNKKLLNFREMRETENDLVHQQRKSGTKITAETMFVKSELGITCKIIIFS